MESKRLGSVHHPQQGPQKSPQDLLLSVQSVVKNRGGSVLARQLILKSDHFDTAVNTRLDFSLFGAPNFRMADLNIFGVAQPTISGISTILHLLQCHGASSTTTGTNVSGTGHHTVHWFSAREEPLVYINQKPFVLRDASNPFENLKTYHGISAERLESMEARLKEDVIREILKYNQLLLVHEEIEDGRVLPTWTSVDSIQTPKEVFATLAQQKGYAVKYVRIPISPEQAPEDHYLDDYVETIKASSSKDPLVFNCGMGVGRTTFAMVVAMILRRAQILQSGQPDPFHISLSSARSSTDSRSDSKTTLRLVYMLEQGLSSKASPRSAIDWALARGPLIEDLRNAIQGNYQCILQLLGLLSQGSLTKRILDEIIDRCDIMINLREMTLMYRVKYYVDGSTSTIKKALGCLERYFFLLAFCSYVSEQAASEYRIMFSSWIKSRTEICRVLENMRLKGPRLYLFRPVEDLSALAEDGQHVLAGWGSSSPAAQPLANELEKHVLKSRVGMVLVTHSILKIDQWYKSAAWPGIEGAANFRKIPHWSVYGVAQPTLGGMKNVLQAVSKDVPDLTTLVWINLREEPLIYINGVPYVLRDQYLTLRNTKTFSGITPARLEVIESRLKDDVRQEIAAYEDRVLLHGETEDGKITPVWEDCEATGVHTFKEVIGIVQSEEKDSDVALSSGKIEGDAPTVKKPLHIDYYRVPITAETPPDLVDLDLLLSVISRVSLSDTAIVVNCQIGLGRSTTGTVIVSLILHWLKQTTPEPFALPPTATKPRLNYQVIHSLLRVIRSGLESKRVVDDVIDYCSTSINLRETIEESRRAAEAEVDETQRKRFIKRGILQLKRYFMLILFQNFLDQNPAEVGDRMTHSFSTWYHKHPEFQSIREELEEENLIPLTPVDYLAPGDGVALTTEVLDVVNRRHGAVLAQGTIVKYDYFPGCQKLSLPDKIDGAPNYRRISLNVIRGATAPYRPMSPSHRYSVDELSMPVLAITESQTATSGSFVYGTAMPTKDAIRRVMTRVGGQGTRRILWTSLREEPVIYVNGRPYVLRLFPDPLRNLEATGIARDRVELMEAQMKRDLVAEIKLFNGRVLLHEEQVQGNSFSIVPLWETVKEEDVQTPLEVYRSIQEEGYNVEYLRLPITDEQAPIPNVFDQLVERLLRMKANTDCIFNCQMGRGRTTTCIVITCLMQMIVGNEPLVQDPLGYLDDDANDEIHQETDDDPRKRYIMGEWKVVLQLVAVLQYGKLAKKLTDKVLDMCDHIQNLRVAIYDYKIRIDALEPGTKKHAALLEIGVNYLVRYFYLIAFADYLLEVWSSNERKGLATTLESSTALNDQQKFSEWLKDRREIVNIIRHQSLD